MLHIWNACKVAIPMTSTLHSNVLSAVNRNVLNTLTVLAMVSKQQMVVFQIRLYVMNIRAALVQ